MLDIHPDLHALGAPRAISAQDAKKCDPAFLKRYYAKRELICVSCGAEDIEYKAATAAYGSTWHRDASICPACHQEAMDAAARKREEQKRIEAEHKNQWLEHTGRWLHYARCDRCERTWDSKGEWLDEPPKRPMRLTYYAGDEGMRICPYLDLLQDAIRREGRWEITENGYLCLYCRYARTLENNQPLTREHADYLDYLLNPSHPDQRAKAMQ